MATATFSRIPPWLQHTVLSRGEWNCCALERSCFGPMHDPTPAVPFHHLAIRLDRFPVKAGWKFEGRQYKSELPPDHVSVIPADAPVTCWWNRPVDFACLYFTTQALDAVLGEEMVSSSHWELRPALAVRAPAISSIVLALARESQMGQPYGRMRGEAFFQQLAALLIADKRVAPTKGYKTGIGDRRVRRALDFIHAHVGEEIDLPCIARAAETSPFHLARLFRQATGYPIWRYVSRLRVQCATGLMRDEMLSLTEVAALSGFASYSTFAATFTAENGMSPSQFRRQSR